MWVSKRTRLNLPLELGYRQIFILPTRFGWMLGILMAAMLIGSLNFNNNLGLLTTFLVAATAINAMLLAFRNLRGLRLQHGGAAPAHAGQNLAYRLAIANPGERERHGLMLLAGPERSGFTVKAQASRHVEITLPAQQRGWQPVGRLCIETTQPLGLFRAWSWFEPATPVLVWPRPAANPPPLPDEGDKQHGQRQHPREEGEEFHSLRYWREGDPLHRIAWKASQRHDALLAREFRREIAPHVLLDLAHAPGHDREQRISVLTAWVLQADAENRPWTLRVGQQRIGPSRGETHRHDCLRALAEA